MAENLNYDAGPNSFCYDDDPKHCETFGRLYTQNEALMDAYPRNLTPSGIKGVCPAGWHVHSEAEWQSMATYVANETGLLEKGTYGYSKIGQKLKATSTWDNLTGLPIDDAYGFSALGAGRRNHYGFYYMDISKYTAWWTASEHDNANGRLVGLWNTQNALDFRTAVDGYGLSVRCLKD